MLTRLFSSTARAAASAAAFAILSTSQAFAVELIMVEQKGCQYCEQWLSEIGPIYPKSPEGAFAPLRIVNISAGAPEGITFARPATFTPTFILVDEGAEIGRIEGYPGEDFFWGLLGMMLKAKTDFEKPDKAAVSN
ncbi:thioredoxin family protein [Lentibacter sp. XHP0401]|uniref:thioredoxin family protein n=1 Tax=Lentibacter sp. XHP0401 TaxID=2984334 RepID=UPI0021E896A1|nr:thioredoxin family protein [Lentibacter sp. XHP0401]MCV2891677.1 thioredoxin family protein [Lentibacter sp. XHP0401]